MFTSKQIDRSSYYPIVHLIVLQLMTNILSSPADLSSTDNGKYLSKTFLPQERPPHAHFYFPDRGAFEGRTSIWQDFRGNFNGRKFKSSEIESDNTIICRLFLLIARQCWRWFMR